MSMSAVSLQGVFGSTGCSHQHARQPRHRRPACPATCARGAGRLLPGYLRRPSPPPRRGPMTPTAEWWHPDGIALTLAQDVPGQTGVSTYGLGGLALLAGLEGSRRKSGKRRGKVTVQPTSRLPPRTLLGQHLQSPSPPPGTRSAPRYLNNLRPFPHILLVQGWPNHRRDQELLCSGQPRAARNGPSIP